MVSEDADEVYRGPGRQEACQPGAGVGTVPAPDLLTGAVLPDNGGAGTQVDTRDGHRS